MVIFIIIIRNITVILILTIKIKIIVIVKKIKKIFTMIKSQIK